MQRKIVFVVNPISGTSPKGGIQDTIASETLKTNIPFHFFPSIANGDYSSLHSIILDENITDVVVVGGDGTVNQVVKSLMHLQVQFGIIPCGSGNGLAFGAGIPRSTIRALNIIFNNHTQFIDGFKVNNRFACVLCGIGFDAQVAHSFAKASHRGLTTYFRETFNGFFLAKPFPFKINLHNLTLSTEAYFISIANSNQFGNNFTIAPKARLNDGQVDVVIVTSRSKLSALYNTMLQVIGLNELQKKESLDESKSVIYFQTNQINIGNEEKAFMHIDGEPIEPVKKIEITIIPGCFKLLIPEK